MWHVYILCCADKTLYTGITTDLERRVQEHNGGRKGARYTRVRQPSRLVYHRAFSSRATAAREEYRIKTLAKPEKLVLIALQPKRLALKKNPKKRVVKRLEKK
ncbi:TPA: endonuclease [Candidatus Falkowbacteria bacterium]|nr:endonuclease [Candidatus Falkowbacteria bacterium]HAY12499.1 endonuclease [Candidatus Falkowbacteria bacterium]HBI97195.1 endonuclease [Candidatus Falkowbacteria bacterium]HBT27435.1 endonuclease [Candidatus Falkowbacteria bacterium]HBY14408.1 endonuclease [Candidatus Falkowbacteria bacterium]